MVLDAVFVGGGVIGLSSAWMAAERGLHVAVVDPAAGRGASWVAAGMLAPVTEAHFGEEDLIRLLVAGAEHWPAFASRLAASSDLEVGYRRCGTVVVAVDADDRAVIDDLLRYQQELGLEATRLSATACRTLVPALSPGVRGGAEVPGDHQVDNRHLVVALLEAAARAGVRLVRDRAVAVSRGGLAGHAAHGAGGSSSSSSSRVDGVVLESGEQLATRAVVLAMGCETDALDGLPPGLLPPIRPVKGHILRLRGDPEQPLLSRTVRALVAGRSCYLVPRRDGTVVLGATVEERGFDRRVQAGAVFGLLHDARTVVPGIDELELVESLVGLRPGSPDNAPFVGWTELDGLAVASGHFRNGILLAPITAEAVTALLVGEAVPAALAGYGPNRLTTEGAIRGELGSKTRAAPGSRPGG